MGEILYLAVSLRAGLFAHTATGLKHQGRYPLQSLTETQPALITNAKISEEYAVLAVGKVI